MAVISCTFMTLAILLADHHLRESLHQVAARITLLSILTAPNMTSSLPVFHIDQPKNDFFITWPLFRVTEAWKVIMWVVSPWRRVKRQFLISAPSYTQTTRHKTSWKARRMKISREIVTSISIFDCKRYRKLKCFQNSSILLL